MELKKWLQIAFINLMIVAALGVVLRYKIAYSLPFVDQKKLLHGHSHFAFSGWVSQALMAIIVSQLSQHSGQNLFRRYRWILYANLVCAYGMLVAFPIEGYGLWSIIFSTCSLVVSYFFAVYVWKDIFKCTRQTVAFYWFRAAVVFNALSSAGPYVLAYMMATKNIQPNWYLASVYFFLHFQYNGWFTFAILGLLFGKLSGLGVAGKQARGIFYIFLVACVPAYFLSALWMPISVAVYIMVVIAAFLQFAAWVWTMRLLRTRWHELKAAWTPFAHSILALSFLAYTIKLLLQLGSTIPALSKLAFGFRPIIIGYLHLVLLGVVSLFIIGYTIGNAVFKVSSLAKKGIIIFITGIIANELALMVQGIAAMSYVSVPAINNLLLAAAFILFAGLLILNIGLRQGSKRYFEPGEVALEEHPARHAGSFS